MALKDLSVKIGADTTGFDRGLKKVKFGLSSLVKTAVGLAGIGLGLKGIADSVRALNDQIVQETKLATVMKTRMAATNSVIGSVKELIRQEESLGVVSKTAQTAGAAELATYLERSDSLKTLIPAMNDLIVSQYGLAASEESAMGVATMMGKVMAGQVGGLSRYGFTFTEAQENIFKYGTETEKAAELAKILKVEVGQVNYALGKTPAGAIKQLGNAFSNLKVSVGKAFEPIIMTVLPALNRMVVFLTDVFNRLAAVLSLLFGYKSVTAEAAAGMAAGADSANDMAEGIEVAGKAAQKTAGFDVFNDITKATGLEGSAGAGGAGSLGVGVSVEKAEEPDTSWLDTVSGKLREFKDLFNFDNLKQSWANLKEALAPIGENIGAGLKWLWDNVLVPFGQWTINQAVPAFLDLISGALRVLNPLLDAVRPLFAWLWENFLQPIGSWTGGIIVSVLSDLGQTLTRIGDWIRNNQTAVEIMAETVLAFFAGLWVYNTTKNIINFLNGLVLALGGVVTPALLVAAGISAITGSIMALIEAWPKMNGLEQVVSVLGAIAIAAATAAAAFGALQSAWSLGLAAAAIVAGTLAIGAAISSANKRARESTEAALSGGGGGGKAFATGGVVYGEVQGIVGDNFNARQDPEVVAPLSSLKSLILEALVQKDIATGGSKETRLTLVLENGEVLADMLIDPLNNKAKNLGYAPVFKPAT